MGLGVICSMIPNLGKKKKRRGPPKSKVNPLQRWIRWKEERLGHLRFGLVLLKNIRTGFFVFTGCGKLDTKVGLAGDLLRFSDGGRETKDVVGSYHRGVYLIEHY